MRAHLGPFLDNNDGEIGRELFQPYGRCQPRGARANDHHVEIH